MFLAQTYNYSYDVSAPTVSAGLAAGALFVFLIWMLFALVIALVGIVALWKIFVKAGQPGWAAIIPIYNMYIMLKVIGRPGWWIILFFIPFVNFIITIVMALDLGKAFGKDAGFSIVLLWLFSIIGYLILGFGKAEYKGVPKHT